MNCLSFSVCLFFSDKCSSLIPEWKTERGSQSIWKIHAWQPKVRLETSWFAFWNSRTFGNCRDSYKFIILFKISHSLTISWPTKCGPDSFVLSLSLHTRREMCFKFEICILIMLIGLWIVKTKIQMLLIKNCLILFVSCRFFINFFSIRIFYIYFSAYKIIPFFVESYFSIAC